MPHIKSTKTPDNCTPLEKLQPIESKADRLLFQYYDGVTTDGAMGFDINAGAIRSAKFQVGIFKII